VDIIEEAEQIEINYLTPEEIPKNAEINELNTKIQNLGVRRAKVLASKKISVNEKNLEIQTIDNECNYYMLKRNKLMDELYGGTRW